VVLPLQSGWEAVAVEVSEGVFQLINSRVNAHRGQRFRHRASRGPYVGAGSPFDHQDIGRRRIFRRAKSLFECFDCTGRFVRNTEVYAGHAGQISQLGQSAFTELGNEILPLFTG
jgi:hypothetical protein